MAPSTRQMTGLPDDLRIVRCACGIAPRPPRHCWQPRHFNDQGCGGWDQHPDPSCHVLRYRERMAEWYSPGYSPSPRRERPAEPLWALERNGRTVACALRDHGEPGGAEVQLLRNGDFYAGRRFDTRVQALRHTDHVRLSLERDAWHAESPADR